MEFELWHYWVIAAFILFIFEVFVPGFILGSMGLGCLLAGLGAYFNLPAWFNILLAIAGFFVGMSLLKPLLKKMEKPTNIKTNAEGLIGRVGKVTERIDPVIGSGRVQIDGDDWKAISVGNIAIEPGCIVEVIGIESIVVTVRKVEYHAETKAEPQPETPPAPSSPTVSNNDKTFIVSIGNKKELIRAENIYCFYSNSKITYLFTAEGKQLVVDDSLEKLEEKLGNSIFFRANRQFIITAKVIKEFRAGTSGKLDVFLRPLPNQPTSISVSRLKAHAFRKWIEKQA